MMRDNGALACEKGGQGTNVTGYSGHDHDDVYVLIKCSIIVIVVWTRASALVGTGSFDGKDSRIGWQTSRLSAPKCQALIRLPQMKLAFGQCGTSAWRRGLHLFKP